MNKRKSYSDALRLFNQVIRQLSTCSSYCATGKSPEPASTLLNALINVLKAMHALTGQGYYSYSDVTNLAALLLESGVIDEGMFSEVVNAYLGLRGIIKIDNNYIIGVIHKLIDIAARLDPYLNQQLNLFRY